MFDAFGRPIHFTFVRTVDAAAEPIITADLKLALRVDHSTEDALIDQYGKAARQQVESDTRRALITQTRVLTLDSAPANRWPIWIPVAPVTAVSLKSFSTADIESTIETSVYRLDTSSLPPRIVLKDGQSWPSDLRPENALQATITAGYGAAGSNVTDVGLIHAVRLLATFWYEQRSPVNIGNIVNELPLAYRALINPLVVPWL